jgi:integrase
VAGFHTFRHTIASRMFAAGRNAVQVQHWLGHHSAAFTLARYVHLLDGDLGGPVEPIGNSQAVAVMPLTSHEAN